MQKIRSLLKIGNSGAALCDKFGSDTGIALELMLGTGVLWEFELHRDAEGESAQLPDYSAEELDFAAGYCAFDLSCTGSDDPPLLIHSGVTLSVDGNGHTVFSVPIINSGTERLTAALGDKSELKLLCELGGFDSDAAQLFAWQFPVTLRNRVYRGGGSDSVVSDPDYFTAVQVQAIAAALEEKIAHSDSKTVSAAETVLADAGGYFAAENVEGALQELGGMLTEINHLLEDI